MLRQEAVEQGRVAILERRQPDVALEVVGLPPQVLQLQAQLLLDGQPTGIVELPIERILDDFPYFGGGANGSNPSQQDVLDVFKDEFDLAYEERGLFILTMHPHITGHRSRVALLDRLIQHIKSKPGVWFATHEEIARHVKPLLGSGTK